MQIKAGDVNRPRRFEIRQVVAEHLAELFDAPVVDQILDAGALAVAAVTVVAEQLDDRLSGLDASFLALEKSGAHMHVGSVLVFDGTAPSYGEFVAQLERRLELVPRYRQKLAFPPLQAGQPVWVDDPHFNLRYHLRHTGLPAPAGRAGEWPALVHRRTGAGAAGRRPGEPARDRSGAGRSYEGPGQTLANGFWNSMSCAARTSSAMPRSRSTVVSKPFLRIFS